MPRSFERMPNEVTPNEVTPNEVTPNEATPIEATANERQLKTRWRGTALFALFATGTMAAAASWISAGCASRPSTAVSPMIDAKPGEGAPPNQTQGFAAMRAAAVQEPSYAIRLNLGSQQETFSGEVTAKFKLASVPQNLAFDFRGGTVKSLRVNGQAVAGAKQVGGLVALPASFLRTGENETAISYEQTYSKSGRGLHRFKDPEDGRVYLYTQFEAFDANHMFPSFDQPDLKATYALEVLAPADWEVVSTMRESSSAKVAEQKTPAPMRTWAFPATPKMSPYVFSMHAGPYKSWRSKAGAVPLRLFARQSLAKYVKPEQWFKTTREGLEFFGAYYDYPYPFKKYDQLIVPDFNSGAMENVAAVTFSERFVQRGPSTRHERERLASVILHEMAHMWFGDLVTMRWWNGLWLNESFATYMSALALAKATEFKESWMTFYFDEKRWAYWEDQLVTTHPINGEVPDTNSAFVNFDGITYGKGASVLKQLAFYVGEDKFRDGVRRYIKDHQYKNTELADFLGALEKSSGKDLKTWARLWLERAGVDGVQPVFKCEEGKLVGLQLLVDAPSSRGVPNSEGDLQRPHRTRVGLYDRVGQGASAQAKLRRSIDAYYQGQLTDVKIPANEKCPDFVYANEGDQDYAKPRLDARSLKIAQESLSGFSDEFSRMMIWPDLYEMVRDGELAATAYVQLALAHLPKETNVKIAEAVLRTFYGRGALYYLPQSNEAERAARLELVGKAEEMAWKGAMTAKPGSDWQKAWFDAYVDMAETPGAIARLADVLAGKTKLSGLVLDQDRRWDLVARLNGFGAPQAEALLAAEKARDKSDVGIRSALAAESIRPDSATKKKMFELATDEKGELNQAKKRSVFGSLFPSWQDRFRAEFAPAFYAELLKRAPTANPEFLRVFVQSAPATCTKESQDALDGFMRANGERLPPAARKPMMIWRQENERCLKARAVSAQAAPERPVSSAR